MARVLRNRILLGSYTFDLVADKYKDKVKALLQEDVKSGKITKDEYYCITLEEYPEDDASVAA